MNQSKNEPCRAAEVPDWYKPNNFRFVPPPNGEVTLGSFRYAATWEQFVEMKLWVRP